MNYHLLAAVESTAEREALCQTLNQYLSDRITILEAGSGQEALDLFFRYQPPIAILDIEMSDISGLQVAEKIREHQNLSSLLFLADSDNFSYARQAIALRALDFLTKPWDEKKLICSVEEALRYAFHLESLTQQSGLLSTAAVPLPPTSEYNRLSLVREDIRSFIASHYMEELSMKNAAHAMNYSDAYFCKLFKQCFQVNFSTYLNEYRIAQAKRMMENPRISIKDISAACGYTDSNYFTRVFKRITGQTPSEYRLEIIEKALNN